MAKFTPKEISDYMNSKDPFMWAFNFLMNCTEKQLTNFVELVQSNRTVIDPNFIWAANAIIAMAQD